VNFEVQEISIENLYVFQWFSIQLCSFRYATTKKPLELTFL